MKILSKLVLVLFLGLMFIGTFFSCKKDVGPSLILTVTDSSGKALQGATVHAYPGNASQGSLTQEANQTQTTDASGEARFTYKNSVVMDIDASYALKRFDSTLQDFVTDTLYGHKIIKLESKRQTGSENDYNDKVEVE